MSIVLHILLGSILLLPGCDGSSHRTEEPMPLDPQQSSEAMNSGDSLLAGLLILVTSNRAEDHNKLLTSLQSEEVLAQLDSVAAYKGPYTALRLWRLMDAIGQSTSSSVLNILVVLITDKTFIANPIREELLLRAVAGIRPAPPSVLSFWEAHCQPSDATKHIVIEAVFKNGSQPALLLFEKKFTDPEFRESDKMAWLYSGVLMHRTDLAVLRICRKLVGDEGLGSLRFALVDVLFDFRPEEWFTPAGAKTPPSRTEASIVALRELQAIGDYAVTSLDLQQHQRDAVRRTLKEIEMILKKK